VAHMYLVFSSSTFTDSTGTVSPLIGNAIVYFTGTISYRLLPKLLFYQHDIFGYMSSDAK